MSKMMHKVKITADHIARGEAENDRSCPIALALTEYFGHQVMVDVIDAKTPYCMIRDKEGWKPLIIDNPDKYCQFVINFDNGKKVKPFFLHIVD